ncbi:MAG: methylamine utilization protein MauG, partial [Thalassolituus sp.]
MNLIRPFLLLTLSAALLACGGSDKKDSVPALNTQETLGAALFNDTNLSLNRTQSCATCHMADHAFSDASTDSSGATRAVSLGDDGVSLGDRNTPTAMYAAFAPDFQFAERSRFNTNQGGYTGWLGGQFWDGRATDLEAQA